MEGGGGHQGGAAIIKAFNCVDSLSDARFISAEIRLLPSRAFKLCRRSTTRGNERCAEKPPPPLIALMPWPSCSQSNVPPIDSFVHILKSST